jgi:serine/threonine protein kinase
MSLRAGASLGRYVIESPLGAGGMGEVYLAEDTGLHRRVALKLLSCALAADDTARKRLVREV